MIPVHTLSVGLLFVASILFIAPLTSQDMVNQDVSFDAIYIAHFSIEHELSNCTIYSF